MKRYLVLLILLFGCRLYALNLKESSTDSNSNKYKYQYYEYESNLGKKAELKFNIKSDGTIKGVMNIKGVCKKRVITEWF